MSAITELVNNYILNHNVAITAAPGNGTTSLCLSIADELAKNEKHVVYFSMIDNIERSFIKAYYPYVYRLCTFIIGTFETLWDYVTENDYMIDVIIIDPADVLVNNSKLLQMLHNSCNDSSISIIFTGQIRQNPNEGGNSYSTLDRLNVRAINTKNRLFEYSIWVNNVTEPSALYRNRYVDIYDNFRVGNRYIKRYIVRFNKTKGNVE